MEKIELKIINLENQLKQNHKLVNLYIKENKNYEEIKKLFLEEKEIIEKINILKIKKIIHNKLDTYNDKLDLYKIEENNKNIKWNIYLHNTLTLIGYIEYRYDNDKYYGNIGYKIEYLYRNNGYALMALNLIKNKLLDRNIEKINITTNNNNLPSIKTIEKFGGELISSDNKVLCYECNLKRR